MLRIQNEIKCSQLHTFLSIFRCMSVGSVGTNGNYLWEAIVPENDHNAIYLKGRKKRKRRYNDK